jgi:hypothetical protein
VKRVKLAALLAFVGLFLIVGPFATHLQNRPVQVRLGYVPESSVLKFLTADQRYLVADWTVLKVIFYFGELLEKAKGSNLYASEPDYPGMFRMLQTGLRIDPYNADAYYLAQAVFTWDVGRAREVNNLLDYGLKYRTWDYQLPFFAGFNAAYFLKDYKAAAVYMKKAAEMSKEQQFATLAARYFYDAGEIDLALMFLDVMSTTAKDDNEKRLYKFRRQALVAAKKIQDAAVTYQRRHGRAAGNIDALVSDGLLMVVPKDPYGGQFYLDQNGKVQTTSKFSFAGARASGSMRK